LTPYFTEKPLYVEGSFIPLTKDETPIREAKRLEFDLPEDAFVMAAFGNVYKITPDMYSTWLEILKEIPKSILWLIDDNTTTTSNLKAHAIKHEADINRIIFTPRASHAEYCAKLKLADVFLDTYPYNCGSTTNDVINAGVPLVTMSGRTMVSRMGGSILSSFLQIELPIYSYKEYSKKIDSISKNNICSQYNFSEKIKPSSIAVKIEDYLRQHLGVK